MIDWDEIRIVGGLMTAFLGIVVLVVGCNYLDTYELRLNLGIVGVTAGLTMIVGGIWYFYRCFVNGNPS